jgi:hypothetical protein
MLTALRLDHVWRMLDDPADGTMRYRACLAPTTEQNRCEDAYCGKEVRSGDGPTLVMCPTMCDRYPYQCDYPQELMKRMESALPSGKSAVETASIKLGRTAALLEATATMLGVPMAETK